MKQLSLLRLSFILSFFLNTLGHSQIISPQGEEIEISYSTKFILPPEHTDNLEFAANEHSNYLMGVIKSERFVKRMGVNFQESEGIGAPRLPHKISAIKLKALDSGDFELSYSYRAKAIIHKDAIRKLRNQASFEVVLPYDYKKVYDKNCTDAHYQSFGDYWYFWDPYRKGCEALLKAPATLPVQVSWKKLNYKKIEEQTRFDLLRADNQNGSLFQIDLITGFDESSSKKDQGWRIFEVLNQSLERNYELKLVKKSGSSKNPLYIFEKEMSPQVFVRVRHLLVDTAIDSKSKAFAKFFKDSVENADVVIYSGHSGLGGNLDIPSLQEKAGEFKFNSKKRQLFYFNSCSSYSYFLEPFRAEKSKAKIDIITNALAAYMDDESAETQVLLRYLLDPEQSPSWMSLLKSMEAESTYGLSYLINVGGI